MRLTKNESDGPLARVQSVPTVETGLAKVMLNFRMRSQGTQMVASLALIGAMPFMGCQDAALDSKPGGSGQGSASVPKSGEATDPSQKPDGDGADSNKSVSLAPSKKQGSAGPQDLLFEPHRVLKIEVELDPKDWESVRRSGRDFGVLVENCESKRPTPDIFDYAKAKIRIDGTLVEEVGVRKKGFLGSLSVARPSLKVKFNEYVKEQRFEGSRRLTLNNNFQDYATLRTCLAYEVFRAAKVPAPRCNYAIVQVNGEAMGVYTHVESIRKPFLRRHFGPKIGPLFESQAADFRKDMIRLFEPKLGEENPDYTNMLAVADALDKGGDSLLKTVKELFDLDALINYWATESLVAHWDGYAGSKNNVYLYQAPSDGKMHLIPWGADTSFSVRGSLIGTPPDDRKSVYLKASLVRGLYKIPEVRERYQARMQVLLDSVWDAEALVRYLDRSAKAIQAAGGKLDIAAMESLKWFIRGRKGQVAADLPGSQIPKQEILDQCPGEVGDFSIDFETVYRGGYRLDSERTRADATLHLNGADVPLAGVEVASSPSYVNGRVQPGLQFSLKPKGGEAIEIDVAVEPINFKSGARFKTQGIATMATAKQGGATGFRGLITNTQFYLEKAAASPGSSVRGTIRGSMIKAVELED